MTPPDTPPNARTDGTGGTGPDTPPPPPTAEWELPRKGTDLRLIHDGIESLLGGVAVAFYMAQDFHCYTVLQERGPIVAQVWTDAAKQSPMVKNALARMMEGGQWGQVIFATASIAIPILDHHGMWPGPNPWEIMTTPADYDARAEAQAASAAMPDTPAGMDVDEASDLAERQRRQAEEKRQRDQRAQAEAEDRAAG